MKRKFHYQEFPDCFFDKCYTKETIFFQIVFIQVIGRNRPFLKMFITISTKIICFTCTKQVFNLVTPQYINRQKLIIELLKVLTKENYVVWFSVICLKPLTQCGTRVFSLNYKHMVYRVIYWYLSNRQQRVMYENLLSSTRSINAGIP